MKRTSKTFGNRMVKKRREAAESFPARSALGREDAPVKKVLRARRAKAENRRTFRSVAEASREGCRLAVVA